MEYSPGTQLPLRQIGAITREDLRAYAEASRDMNPIHLDDAFAKAVGLPSVIVHGMLSMGIVANYLSEIFDKNEISRIKGRFRHVTVPDVPLRCTGGVVREIEPGRILVKAALEDSEGQALTQVEAEIKIDT